MSNKASKFSHQIIKVYLVGAVLLLVLYGLAVNFAVVFTENMSSEKRLSVVADFHFEHYRNGATGPIQIDPLLTLYDDYDALPPFVQARTQKSWTGLEHYQIDIDTDYELEFIVFADRVSLPTGDKVLYAVEDSRLSEWNELDLLLFDALLAFAAIVLLLIACFFIVKTARQLSSPFRELSQKLASSKIDDFSEIELAGKRSLELEETVSTINDYRGKLADFVSREKSFTRYVSHELRTPMMAIRGALNVAAKKPQQDPQKQFQRINKALDKMEQLVSTFLLLARKDEDSEQMFTLDKAFIETLIEELSEQQKACQVTLEISAVEQLTLAANPTLVTSVLYNLLLNAYHHTFNGLVTLNVSANGIFVTDSGSGLEGASRSQHSHGIGLVLVRDICNKYGWHFSLSDNPTKGCTAKVLFDPR